MHNTQSDLTQLTPAQRREYLRYLWRADVKAETFTAAARQLSIRVTNRWDYRAGMPVLAWLH